MQMISGRPTLGIYVNSDFRLTFDPSIEQQPANGHKRRIQSESAASLLPPLSSLLSPRLIWMAVFMLIPIETIDIEEKRNVYVHRAYAVRTSKRNTCDAIPRQSFEMIRDFSK